MESWLEPLHDAASMRATDAWAIEDRSIPSLELMEAAGLALAEAVEGRAREGPIRIVCGKGNNGGDGLVAARRLASFGHRVEVLLLGAANELSEDARANLERFEGPAGEPAGDWEAALDGSGAIVDAIFGTGFSGAPREPAAAAIDAINACPAPVVSADIASGVDASSGEVAGAAVEANLTVSFHAAKLGALIAPGKWCCGELRVAAIGIPDDAPAEAPAGVITAGVLALAPRRGARSTKFSSGEVLIVGGSPGLSGAVCLSAAAAIRAGAGYATAAVPAELEPVIEVKLTEVMSRGMASSRDGGLAADAADAIVAAAARAACVVAGPGMGRGEGLSALVGAIADGVEAPLLIDADGLGALAGELGRLAARRAPTVLTPHAGELARLLEIDSDEVGAHRLACARELAARSHSIVVLKGDDSIVVAADGRPAVNRLASPALATAGTGDVLGGLVGALLARGVEPFAAACAGVLAHARAGRIAATRIGSAESVIAGDVIDALPEALASEGTDR